MKKIYYFFLVLFLFCCSISIGGAYFFGLKSTDNTIENIKTIEQTYEIHLPIVAFIFDPWGPWVETTLNNLNKELGTQRIYHITISPDNYSSKQVAEGIFDKQYTTFFKGVKNNNLRVIFRSMHEMNGGRYPRASDPENFKKAWIHVWKLSRKVGLDQKNILFDMSVNHWDMPTKQTPSQTAKLIPCKLQNKERLKCFTFEDYYPGNEYVDIMGFTFYNRGKGNSSRLWLTPNQIVNEKGWEILPRLKKIGKPIFVDEVGTTAVWYSGDYKHEVSQYVYKTNYKLKNIRLNQLQQLLQKETSLLGAVYFNVDYTDGLKRRLIGEADRAVINTKLNKLYYGIFDLINTSDNFNKTSGLLNMFGIREIQLENKKIFVPLNYKKPIEELNTMIATSGSGDSQKLRTLKQLDETGSIKKLYKKLSHEEINEIIEILKNQREEK